MNYFGFIKEHDDYDFATNINELIVDEGAENPKRIEIIEYLKKGELCAAHMGSVEDAMNPRFNDETFEDNDFMGYIAVYTDGVWFWPEYIVNYLQKYPKFKIDDVFVKHVIKNKNKKITISEEEIMKLEKEFYNKNWR